MSDTTLQGISESEQSSLKAVERLIEQTANTNSLPMLIGSDGSSIELPPYVFELLHTMVHHLVEGQIVTIVPIEKQLTTQQAADILNVSRPYLISLLERKEIPYTKIGTHRRIKLADVAAYKSIRDIQRTEALDDLALMSQELGLYDKQ